MNLPWKKKTDPTILEKEIERVTEKLSKLDPTAEGYAQAAENLATLMEAKNDLDKVKRSGKPSADTILTVAGSIASIVIIVGYEHAHVFVSKAISQVIKPRV